MERTAGAEAEPVTEAERPVGGREGRIDRRVRRTRRRILEAAVELFAERGFEGVTIEEIAARAEVARGTVFNHFSTKESLCEALNELQLERLQEAVQEGRICGPGAGDKIAQALQVMAEFPTPSPERCRQLLSRSLTCLRPGELSASAWQIFGMFEAWAAEGQRNGEFRADLPPCELAGFIMGLRFQATLIWAYGFVEGSLADFTVRLLRLALEGIRTRSADPGNPAGPAGR